MVDNCREMNTYEAILLAKTYHQEGMRIIKQAPTDIKDVQEFICPYIVGYTNSGKSTLLNLLANGTVVLESIFVPSIVETYMELAEIAGLGTDPFVIFAAICLAPIGEELLCRGLTMKYAEKAFGKFWVANVLQAIVFGVMHANWVQGIYAFLIGIALGYMTKKYKSIIPAMICHFVVNFSSSTWIPYVLEPIPANVFTGLLLTILPVAATVGLFIWDSKKDVTV